jgi:hypothetical protein
MPTMVPRKLAACQPRLKPQTDRSSARSCLGRDPLLLDLLVNAPFSCFDGL